VREFHSAEPCTIPPGKCDFAGVGAPSDKVDANVIAIVSLYPGTLPNWVIVALVLGVSPYLGIVYLQSKKSAQ